MMVTNPLDGITHFFVNPRMIDGFKQLKLDECCYPDQLSLDENLPILTLPMEALGLDKAVVTLDDNGRNGKIKTNGLTIYFNKHDSKKNTIRINTVLGSKPRKNSDEFELRMTEIVKSIVKEENIWL
jgi:hypothetical protein